MTTNLSDAEIKDVVLILERYAFLGEDTLQEDFELTEDQPKDMLANVKSALRKLRKK